MRAERIHLIEEILSQPRENTDLYELAERICDSLFPLNKPEPAVELPIIKIKLPDSKKKRLCFLFSDVEIPLTALQRCILSSIASVCRRHVREHPYNVNVTTAEEAFQFTLQLFQDASFLKEISAQYKPEIWPKISFHFKIVIYHQAMLSLFNYEQLLMTHNSDINHYRTLCENCDHPHFQDFFNWIIDPTNTIPTLVATSYDFSSEDNLRLTRLSIAYANFKAHDAYNAAAFSMVPCFPVFESVKSNVIYATLQLFLYVNMYITEHTQVTEQQERFLMSHMLMGSIMPFLDMLKIASYTPEEFSHEVKSLSNYNERPDNDLFVFHNFIMERLQHPHTWYGKRQKLS